MLQPLPKVSCLIFSNKKGFLVPLAKHYTTFCSGEIEETPTKKPIFGIHNLY
jgi:hypothetical protein